VCGFRVVTSSVVNLPFRSLQVRQRALRVLLQILASTPGTQLRDALRNLPLAAFLASLLGGRDVAMQAAALLACELLLAQLPDVFRRVFQREGVAHAICLLATGQAESASASPVKVPEGDPGATRQAARAQQDAPRAPNRASELRRGASKTWGLGRGTRAFGVCSLG
jgi:E3 ubiquitin-protein ligase TRIP12